jgi:hypothetical protein
MAEPRDDKVSAAFRAMPPLEPPPALDDAIRAAARRAVKAKPETALRRWAVPASVAAVLALSIGIAMHVDWRKPMVVDGTPVPSGSGEYPVTQAPAEAPPPPLEASRAKRVARDAAMMNAAPEPKAKVAEAPAERREAKPVVAEAPEAATMAAPSPAPEKAVPAPPTPAPPAPQAFPAMPVPAPAAPAASAPPPPAMARMQSGAAAPTSRAAAPAQGADQAGVEVAPMRAKDEAAGGRVAKEAVAQPPAKQLERIAELRAAGRHAEADEALAKFRRDYPDYRIAPELWEKVKPR